MSDVNLSMTNLSVFHFWKLIEVQSKETYNGLNEATLLCFTNDTSINPKDLIGKIIQWEITTKPSSKRSFFGVIQDANSKEQPNTMHSTRYLKMHVTCPIGNMIHNTNSRTWSDESIEDILEDVFKPYKNQFCSTYATTTISLDFSKCQNLADSLEYIVQYQQSDFDFLQAICHEQNLFYSIKTSCKLENITVYGTKVYQYSMTIEFGDHVCSYEQDKNTLYWPTDHTGATQAKEDIMYDLSIQTYQAPNQFLGNDYNPLTVNVNLAQLTQTGNNDQQIIGPMTTFPSSVQDFDALNTDINIRARRATEHTEQWFFNTGEINLTLASTLKIQHSPHIDHLMPISILHEAREYGHHTKSGMQAPMSILSDSFAANKQGGYSNTVQTIPWIMQPYFPPCNDKHKAKTPSTFAGEVMGPSNLGWYTKSMLQRNSTIDFSDPIFTDSDHPVNRVKVWLPWDQNNPQKDYDRCPWVRVIHNQNGQQYLPHTGDEVVVAYANNRIDRPIIMGCTYNADNTPPLNIKDNVALSGIKTAYSTKPKAHFFYFDNKLSNENIAISSASDYTKTVGNSLDKTPSTYRQEITENFIQYAYEDMNIDIEDSYLKIESPKAMIFEVNGSKIEILPHKINLSSGDITLNTPNGMTGNLANVGSNHSCPKHNPDNSPHVGGPVTTGSSNVFFADMPAARQGDQAKCQGPTDTISTGNSDITVNGQPVAVVTSPSAHGGQVTSGVSNISAGQSGCSGMNVPIIDKNFDVTLLFKMSAKKGFEPVIAHAVANLHAIEDAAGKSILKDHADIPTNQLSGKTTIHDVKGGNLIKGYNYACSLSPHARELAIFNVNGKPCFPYYQAKLAVPTAPNKTLLKTDKARQFDAKVLWPIMVLNCRGKGHGYQEAKDQGAFDELNSLDIQYFKENGNNVTVFIHGYNVDAGELSNEFSHIVTEQEYIRKEKELKELYTIHNGYEVGLELTDEKYIADHELQYTPIKTPFKCSIWRNPFIVRHQLNQPFPDNYYLNIGEQDTKLNGSGAFNWAINMEKNINEAAGADFKDPSCYDKFTRMLHATWSGNNGQASYIESVDQAYSPAPAKKLANALAQLKQAGLNVNVIAHSLGNGFLLNTMHSLAYDHPGVVLDHVFMWEAAVPNNVFNRPKPKHNHVDRWDFKKALDATKKITVLHSYNDNILGPFPTDQQQKAQLKEVYRHKPLAEWLSAYFCDLFQLKSLYMIAMAMNVETHLILDPDVQEMVYSHLLEQHHDLIAYNETEEEDLKAFHKGMFMPTLAQQMHFVAKTDKYSTFKNQMNGAITKYHDDWSNKSSKLNTFLQFHPMLQTSLAVLNETPKAIRTYQEIKKWYNRLLDAIDGSLMIGTIFAPEVFVPLDVEYISFRGGFKWAKEQVDYIAEKGAKKWVVKKACGKMIKYVPKYALPIIHKFHSGNSSHTLCAAPYLMTMLKNKHIKAWHVPAMGYEPDKPTEKKYKGKINYVNQTKWLFQHSGMKIPSKNMKTHVYKDKIMDKATGIKKFGDYP